MAQPQITVKDASSANVTVFTHNPNGPTTSANAQPVVIASDQPAVPVTDVAAETSLAAILAKQPTAPALDSSLATLHADLGTLGTQVTAAAILAKLVAAPALDATVATMSAKIPALGAAVKTAALPVVLATDQPPVAVVGSTVVASAAFARPANTTAYTALNTVSDSVSAPTLLTFAAVARIAAGTGYITKARLLTDGAGTVARFRLHLFHTAPTQINDGSPFTALYANRSAGIGRIDFDACITEGTGSTAAGSLNTAVRLAFGCDAGLQAIYGILESLDPFTPASGQNFFIELTAEQN